MNQRREIQTERRSGIRRWTVLQSKEEEDAYLLHLKDLHGPHEEMGGRMRQEWKGGENKEIFEMKAFRAWTDGTQRGGFLLTRAVGGMWNSCTPQQEQRRLTQGDEFTGDLLLAPGSRTLSQGSLWLGISGSRNMSPVPTACRAAARDHQTDQQFHPTCTQLEPVTPVTANYPANNSILSINKSIMYISAAIIVSVPYKRCLQT